MSTPDARVVYQEALRTVDDQVKTLENVRARAGTLFSSAGVVVAVLGFAIRHDAKGDAPSWAVSAGLISFLILAAATVVIWWPPPKGRFRMAAAEMVGDWIEGDEPLAHKRCAVTWRCTTPPTPTAKRR
jgi:hypothetical protein